MSTTEEPTPYDVMRTRLITAQRVGNDKVAERDRTTVIAEALVDIAESLRGIFNATDYAWTAANLEPLAGNLEDEPDEREQDASPDDAPLEPGDLVVPVEYPFDPAHDDDVLVIIDAGATEGAQWVRFAPNGTKVWARQYRRVLKPDESGAAFAEALAAKLDAEVPVDDEGIAPVTPAPRAADGDLRVTNAELKAADDDDLPDAFTTLKAKRGK